jgi:hypothetical protein
LDFPILVLKLQDARVDRPVRRLPKASNHTRADLEKTLIFGSDSFGGSKPTVEPDIAELPVSPNRPDTSVVNVEAGTTFQTAFWQGHDRWVACTTSCAFLQSSFHKPPAQLLLDRV